MGWATLSDSETIKNWDGFRSVSNGRSSPILVSSPPSREQSLLYLVYMLGFCVRLSLRKGSLMKINESVNDSFLGLP